MLAPTRVFRQFEQYAKPVPGQTGAGFVVSGGVFALQRFYKMYRVDDAEAVGVGGGGCQAGKRKKKRKPKAAETTAETAKTTETAERYL